MSNKYKTITIINDCRDANAAGRQVTRVASLLGVTPNFIGVNSYDEIEAAGNIIDTLDAIGDQNALILVNVAPRHGNAKKWKNGSPFGWLKYKNTYIISTIDGNTLSLIKKFKLTNSIHVFDFEKTANKLLEKNIINKSEHTRLLRTQFRSFDFTPRVAALDLENNLEITDELLISEIPDAPNAIWWIDNFGNCKTTLIEDDLKNIDIKINNKNIKFFNQLKDVPNNHAAIIVGSSGLENKRFVELVVQGESAAKKFGLKTGDEI